MLNKLKPKSQYTKNILTLMSGTILAQAIPIAASPILTRLYTPSDFGIFALYFSLLVLLGSISAGRYELAILIPKQRTHALSVVHAAIAISVAFCLLLFIFIAWFNDDIVAWLDNKEIEVWLYLLPLNVLLLSIGNILYYWNNRHEDYKTLAKSKVFQNSIRTFVSVLLGMFHFLSGLIAGVLIGSLTYVGFLFLRSKRHKLYMKINIRRTFAVMKRFKDFPKFNIFTTLFENISAQLPIFLLSIFFTPAIVGFFSLSQQVVRAPLGVIGVSFGDVFRQKASHDLQHTGNCRAIFIETFKKLFFLAVAPFVIFYFVAPFLFAWVFGKEWYIAGVYAQIMTPLFFLQFLSSPLSNMFLIAEKQKIDLLLQIFTFALTLIGMSISYYYFHNVEAMLIVFTAIYCIKYLIQLTLSYQFTYR